MSPRMDGAVSWVHVSPIFIDRASAESALAQFPSTRADRVVVYRYGSGEWKEVPKRAPRISPPTSQVPEVQPLPHTTPEPSPDGHPERSEQCQEHPTPRGHTGCANSANPTPPHATSHARAKAPVANANATQSAVRAKKTKPKH